MIGKRGYRFRQGQGDILHLGGREGRGVIKAIGERTWASVRGFGVSRRGGGVGVHRGGVERVMLSDLVCGELIVEEGLHLGIRRRGRVLERWAVEVIAGGKGRCDIGVVGGWSGRDGEWWRGRERRKGGGCLCAPLCGGGVREGEGEWIEGVEGMRGRKVGRGCGLGGWGCCNIGWKMGRGQRCRWMGCLCAS